MTQPNHPTLTSRQLEILLLLYRFRFLTRSHIQTLLHHKNHAHILKWLNELTSQNYITQYYTKTIPASPAIYSLAKLGRSYLKIHTDSNTKHLSRLRRDPIYTSKFRNHCLFLADIYISLLEVIAPTRATLHFSTKAELYGMASLIKPVPDAYIATKEATGTTKRYFLDIFDNMPPVAMRKRVRQYFEYCDSDEWQSSTDKPFPAIILICPNDRLKKHLTLLIQRKLESGSGIIFYLSTKECIATNGLSNGTLKRVIMSS